MTEFGRNPARKLTEPPPQLTVEHAGFAFAYTFLTALLQTLAQPLFLPLLHPSLEQRAHGFQVLYPFNGNSRRPAEYNSVDPDDERAPKAVLLRVRQPLEQRAYDGEDFSVAAAVLEPEQSRDKVAKRLELAFAVAAFVDNQIARLRLIPLELARAGLHQRCQLLRCIPTRSLVCEHYRQHRRQEASGAELLAVDQVLIQKADVGVKAHGHVALDRGLDLEQQVDVDPSRSPSSAPDDIVAALAQVVADITAGDSLERTVVELLEPRLLDEALEQIAHHLRMGEQQLVTMIVIGQQLSSLGAGIVYAS